MRRGIFLTLLLCLPCHAVLITIDADDFGAGENMHQPCPEVRLWRADKLDWDNIETILDQCYADVTAIESTHPTGLMGENVIADPLGIGEGPSEYWSQGAPFLLIEFLDGYVKSFSATGLEHPLHYNNTLILETYGEDGTQYGKNFRQTNDMQTTTVTCTNVEYIYKYAVVTPSHYLCLDHLVIDYQAIPEPSTLLLLGISALFLHKKGGRRENISNE